MQKWIFSSLVLLLNTTSTPAFDFVFLNDDADGGSIAAVRDQKDVVQFRQKLDEFTKPLYRLKKKDFIALYGKSMGWSKPLKTYAMPVAQPRKFIMSGLSFFGSERHNEFYIVKDVVGLEVRYDHDGATPYLIVCYFPVDKDFPKLTKDNLAKRLSWEEDRFKKLLAYHEKRMVEVFPWEIDQKELAKLQQGDFAIDSKTKLEAWIKSGNVLGYKHERQDGRWFWYRPNGKLAREACNAGRKDGPQTPVQFLWYHEDGRSELRKEEFDYDTGELRSRRWERMADGRPNIRYELAGSRCAWSWQGKDGNGLRCEWDDNGDGIPDWYAIEVDDMNQRVRKPLKLEESWAIHPELIPAECRILDQPELRVPIRRKKAAEPAKK